MPLFAGLFTGYIFGFLIAIIGRSIIVFDKNAPYRHWVAERKIYNENTTQQFEKSRFVALVSEDVIGFYNALVSQSKQFNVKSTKFFFSLYPEGCSYSGSVNCPYRERMNNKMSDQWHNVYETGVPFDRNNFVFLNIEQRDIMYSILVNRLFEKTKGKRTRFQTNRDSYTIEILYDNNAYKEPSLNEVW